MNDRSQLFFGPFAKGLFFALNTLAIYLLLRGHNEPGGGFIAGLVTAISVILISLALGWLGTGGWMKWDPARVAFAGLWIAAGTALVPALLGYPVLQGFVWKGDVPWFGEAAVGTALIFDTGVYLAVVGITTKMVTVLGRSSQGVSAFPGNETSRYAAGVEEPIELSTRAEALPPLGKEGADGR